MKIRRMVHSYLLVCFCYWFLTKWSQSWWPNKKTYPLTVMEFWYPKWRQLYVPIPFQSWRTCPFFVPFRFYQLTCPSAPLIFFSYIGLYLSRNLFRVLTWLVLRGASRARDLTQISASSSWIQLFDFFPGSTMYFLL